MASAGFGPAALVGVHRSRGASGAELRGLGGELFGVPVADDAFLFSLAPDCSTPMSAGYFTNQVAKLKDHLGIPDKRPATIALEDEALRLFRLPPQRRPPGRPGRKPKGGMSYDDIGRALNRSGQWAKNAVTSARRREELAQQTKPRALRRVDPRPPKVQLQRAPRRRVQREGRRRPPRPHPDTLLRHHAKRRDSADIQAAEHLGQVAHRRKPRPKGPDLTATQLPTLVVAPWDHATEPLEPVADRSPRAALAAAGSGGSDVNQPPTGTRVEALLANRRR